MTMHDRLPPLAAEAMDDGQKKAAAELIAGPRGGVRGPFIPLLRSSELMATEPRPSRCESTTPTTAAAK